MRGANQLRWLDADTKKKKNNNITVHNSYVFTKEYIQKYDKDYNFADSDITEFLTECFDHLEVTKLDEGMTLYKDNSKLKDIATNYFNNKVSIQSNSALGNLYTKLTFKQFDVSPWIHYIYKIYLSYLKYTDQKNESDLDDVLDFVNKYNLEMDQLVTVLKTDNKIRLLLRLKDDVKLPSVLKIISIKVDKESDTDLVLEYYKFMMDFYWTRKVYGKYAFYKYNYTRLSKGDINDIFYPLLLNYQVPHCAKLLKTLKFSDEIKLVHREFMNSIKPDLDCVPDKYRGVIEKLAPPVIVKKEKVVFLGYANLAANIKPDEMVVKQLTLEEERQNKEVARNMEREKKSAKLNLNKPSINIKQKSLNNIEENEITYINRLMKSVMYNSTTHDGIQQITERLEKVYNKYKNIDVKKDDVLAIEYTINKTFEYGGTKISIRNVKTFGQLVGHLKKTCRQINQRKVHIQNIFKQMNAFTAMYREKENAVLL
jgi:hypothetical protein